MATSLTPSFYRPTLHGPSRSYCPVAWGSGVLLPGWPVKDLFFFNGSSVSLLARVDSNALEDGNGFISSGIDSNGQLWLLSADGGCYTASKPTSVTLGTFVLGKDVLGYGSESVTAGSLDIESITLATSLPYGPYSGGCADTNGEGFYVVSAAGEVFRVSVGSYEKIGSFGALARSPVIMGAQLYVTLPGSSSIGVMALADGSFTTADCGMGTPAFCQPTTEGIWVAGADASEMTQAANGIQVGSAFSISFSGSNISLLSGSDPIFTVLDTVDVGSSIVAIEYIDSLSQAIVLTISSMIIYTIVSEKLTVSQTFNLTSPIDFTLTPENDTILVATESSVILFSASLGTWAQESETISESFRTIWAGETSVSTQADPTVIGGTDSTVKVLASSGDTWAEYFSFEVTGTVQGFAGDTTDALAVSSAASTSTVTRVSFAGHGAGDSIVIDGTGAFIVGVGEGAYAVLTTKSASSVITYIAVSAGSLSIVASTNLAFTASRLDWTDSYLWVDGRPYQKGPPGTFTPVVRSKSSLIVGSGVTVWSLGSGSSPSGIAAGLSNIIILMADNTIYTQALGGSDPVEYDLSVFSGQDGTTPMNIAGAVLGTDQVFVSTSASGEIMVIAEDW